MGITGSLDAAMVFTNERNEVVFADRNFYRLLRRDDSESVVGERLHRTLGLVDDNALRFLRDVLDDGYIRDTVLEFTDRRGQRIRVTATGRAATDEGGKFIGTNLELWGAITVLSGDILSVEVVAELPAEVPESTELGMVQAYFIAHMTALYVLLMRSVGERVCKRLDETVNKAAQKNQVATRMSGGLVDFDPNGEDAKAYPVLLTEAIRFAMDILGRRVVDRELRIVTERIDERTLALAGEYRLLDLAV